MDHSTNAKTVTAVLASVLSYLFGEPDIWLKALVAAVAIDYTSGLCKAYILGTLNSRVGFRGIARKVLYFAIVAVAVIADNLSGAGGAVRSAVIGFLIGNEGISVLENCAAADLPVPEGLINVLNRIKGNDEEAS